MLRHLSTSDGTVSEPTLGEMFLLIRETRDDVKDIREAVFTGHEGQPPVLSRLSTLEERTKKVEQVAPKAGMLGGLGAIIGGAIVVILGYFGLGPPKQ